MRILFPDKNPEYESLSKAIFLAGPCPRKPEQEDWRDEAIEIFSRLGFDGDLIIPTNRHFDHNLPRQTAWEYRGLCYASCILFWIPRSFPDFPAFTTNYEFGEWFKREGVVVGYPDGSIKNDYIGVKLQQWQKERFSTLEDCCRAAMAHVNAHGRRFYTSDTHFSQQRTFELSRRPFLNVDEMDCQMISNWNKRVQAGDIVVHLGDFGNPKVLPLLGFKRMYIVAGNYEKVDDCEPMRQMEKIDPRVRFIRSGTWATLRDGSRCRLTHEPYAGDEPSEDFWLFGHIHRGQMVKRNGMNVATDLNFFTPFKEDDIVFVKDAIQKHYDENVFTENVTR